MTLTRRLVSRSRVCAAHKECVDNQTDTSLAAELARRAETFTGRGTVTWIDQAGRAQIAAADPELGDRELYLARPVRVGNRYPRQRNYHGWYSFSQTRRHVWFESKLEQSRLASIDHCSDVVAIASQPMKIEFTDGTEHFPDFLALHGTTRQVLYDVKPRDRVTSKYLDQFARTKALCDQVGWGYSVLTELDPVERANLDWLRNFRHTGHHPGLHNVARLLPALPLTVLDAATLLSPNELPAGRSAVFHLAWGREVTIDTARVLSDESIVEVPRA